MCDPARVKSINIQGLAGNDTIRLGSNNVTDKYGQLNDPLFRWTHYSNAVGAIGSTWQPLAIPAYVDGGDGNDTITGGSQNDTLLGGAGDDHIFGGDGANVVLDGGPGNDVLYAGAGHDLLKGGDGDDTLVGGTGTDSLLGGAGNDVLVGRGVHDYLDGGTGFNLLVGGGLQDTLLGSASPDVKLGQNLLIAGMINDDILKNSVFEFGQLKYEKVDNHMVWTRDGNSLEHLVTAFDAQGNKDTGMRVVLDAQTVVDDGSADVLSGVQKQDVVLKAHK